MNTNIKITYILSSPDKSVKYTVEVTDEDSAISYAESVAIQETDTPLDSWLVRYRNSGTYYSLTELDVKHKINITY